MNRLDFFVKTYNSIRNIDGLPIWLLTPIRRLVRLMANELLPRYLSRACSLNKKSVSKADRIIVSLTSFPARIDNVWQVIECMKRQTISPDKIILWLSKEQFSSKKELPASLQMRENDLFQIRFVDGDIKSHKKYAYVVEEFKNDLIFLVDDDIYYATDIIERSLEKYMLCPHSVVCNYGSQVAFDEDGRHLSYSSWNRMTTEENLFFGSGGGTLFRPSDMYKDLSNMTLATRLTPTADDIWLNAMARLAGIRIVKASDSIILPIYSKNNIELTSLNNGESQNDVQLALVEDYYGRCFDKIK